MDTYKVAGIDLKRIQLKEKLYQDAEWMKEKYIKEGLHVDEIAQQAGCTGSTITVWLRKLGIPLWETIGKQRLKFKQEVLESMCKEGQKIIYCAELGYPDVPLITDNPERVMPFLHRTLEWRGFFRTLMCIDHHDNKVLFIRGTFEQGASGRKINGPEVREYSLHSLVDYTTYIQSEEWHQKSLAIRQKVGKCQVCGSTTSLRAHHNTYKTLGEEQEYDITVLCNSCHKIFHSNSKIHNGPKPQWINIGRG